jgi:Skp family chaperone for outer membrane proteins
MRTLSRLAVSGLVLSLFAAPVLAQNAGDHVDADGLPTNHSTPAEHAQTESLNNQVQQNNAAADAQVAQTQAATDAQAAANNANAAANQVQYDQQKQQYQQQLQQNQTAQQNYEDRTRAYNGLRSRYAAERAAYHRGAWPDRFVTWHLQSDAGLIGSRVEIINGDHVGTVDSVARAPGGRIEALYVTLDGGKQVWIDEADVRFDTGAKVVMTNLDRNDLRAMSDERL